MLMGEGTGNPPIVDGTPSPFNLESEMEKKINEYTINYIIIGCVSFVASTIQVRNDGEKLKKLFD
jgi:hypothetical protein